MSTDPDVEARTRRWIEQVVVGLSLCPFARPVLPTLRIAVTPARDLEALLGALAAELGRLVGSDPTALPTTVLVVPEALADFDDYLDALAVVEAALEDAGLEGEIQVASFHPRYRFEGAPADDPANYSNRSPYPMFHLLREADVGAAVDAHPDPEGIPARNIERLRAMGVEAIRALTA